MTAKPGLLILTSILLSACVGAQGDSQDESTSPAADPDLGTLEGTVTDEELIPVVGATIALLGTGLVASSVQDGGFRMSELAPGRYDVQVSAPNFQDRGVSVDVASGETTPLIVQLVRIPGSEPFTVSLNQRGFIGCWVQWRSPAYSAGFAACQVPGTAAGVSGFDRSILTWNVTAPHDGLNGTVLDQRWTSTQATGSSLRVGLILYCYYVEGLGAAEGQTPLRIQVASPLVRSVVDNATRYNDPIANGDPVCGDRGATKSALACIEGNCRFQTTTRPIAAVLGASAPVDVGAALQQTYEQFLTVFVWRPMPESFTALPDE